MTSCLNHLVDTQLPQFIAEKNDETYTLWLRTQIDNRLVDKKRAIPHNQVMSRIDTLLKQLT